MLSQTLDLIVLIRTVSEVCLEMPWSPSYEPSKFVFQTRFTVLNSRISRLPAWGARPPGPPLRASAHGLYGAGT